MPAALFFLIGRLRVFLSSAAKAERDQRHTVAVIIRERAAAFLAPADQKKTKR